MPGKERPDAGRASRAGRPFTIPDMEVESVVIGDRFRSGRPGVPRRSPDDQRQSGRITVSMTWITPFDALMSVFTTFALSIFTP